MTSNQTKGIWLSSKAFGLYGIALGYILSFTFTTITTHFDTIKKTAVNEYKIEQFSPKEFEKMKTDISDIKSDLRDIKKLLSGRNQFAFSE